MFRKLFKLLGWLLAAFLLYIVAFLLFGSLTDWAPEGTEELSPSTGKPAAEVVMTDSIVRLITWNVGYGGIGDKDFFFYNQPSGFWWTKPGTVRMSRERIGVNVTGQEITIKGNPADIYLLQEVDTSARRSHYVNQLAVARSSRKDYAAYFATNFKSQRVPIPLFQPWDHYGYVVGGLVNLSRYQPVTAERIQLDGEFGWPTKLFQLDRCALRQVTTVADGKELAVYNVHLSAYDEAGTVRGQQMAQLKALAEADYAAGRYVIIGGDWNQLPPGFNWFGMNPTVKVTQLPFAISHDFMTPDWQYAFDPTTATNRTSGAAYDPVRTRKNVIDFFLLSPNLRIKMIKGIEQGFRYSDHQPVYLEAELL
jgi:endonuclease/exonuclease/phosphatase family metal-dependent hydrolase